MRYVDAIIIAYRLGRVRHDVQKQALLAAARAATDAMTFMTAMENFGIARTSQLHGTIGEIMAAPDHFRARYPTVVGIPGATSPPCSFLNSQHPLALVEPILTTPQYKLFYDTYWWFAHNHQPYYYDPRKGQRIGAYATEPKDNHSTVIRFEDYLYRLVNHSSLRIRSRFEGFPADVVMALLRRAFP